MTAPIMTAPIMTAPMTMKILTAAMALGMALPAGALAQPEQQAPPPARVETVTATREMLAPVIQVPGTVISRNDSRIASEISGRIMWVAEVGDAAKKGDAIARVDDRLFKLALVQAKARSKRLEANLAFRQKDVQRVEELAATRNTPVSRLEEAISQRDMVTQDLVEARADEERARQDLDRTVVRAPFPGRVVARLAEMGEYASTGTELVRLVDTYHVEVRAQAPISTAAFIESGMVVMVEADNGEIILTPIRAFVPVGNEISRMMEVRIALPDEGLIIGSAVKVSLPSANPRSAVVVPRDALILRLDSIYVFKVNSDNTAERIEVRTGAASGELIEVIGPVKSGDRVVVRGGERLREGQAVAMAK